MYSYALVLVRLHRPKSNGRATLPYSCLTHPADGFLVLSAEAASALALKHAQEGTNPEGQDSKFEEDALEEEPLIGFLMTCPAECCVSVCRAEFGLSFSVSSLSV